MKTRYLIILTLLAVMAACKSSERLLREGNYQKAIEKSVRKLQRKPDKEDEIIVLKKAYPRANEEDMERIQYLKQDLDEDKWGKIYLIYKKLKKRQDLVETVLPLKLEGERIDFPTVDYSKKIIAAKENAAESHYEKGISLLRSTNKADYREAYYEFKRAMDYIPSYKDARNQMESAKEMGTIYTMITAENKTRHNFNENFYDEIFSFGVAGLEDDWVKFLIKPYGDNFEYDYNIVGVIDEVDISPEKTSKDRTSQKRKIRDGWEYELDANGNVKKDTAGNDIKKPKYKEITCRVTEIKQYKAAEVEGQFVIIENRTGQELIKRNIDGKAEFRYSSYEANGDLRALNKKTRELLHRDPAPFPDSDELVLEAAEEFGKKLKSLIYQNKRYIK